MTEPRNCPQCGAELPADAPSGLCPRCLLNQRFESQPAEKENLAETAAPATRFTAPSPADLARHFPQLEVLELLGQGGMGAVYKARQPTLDRLVALKILPAEVGRDPAFAERFTREARALARLSHPNIVGIYDFGQADGLYYFIMEYVDGVSLRQLVESRQLSPAQALALVPQICEALQFAHDEGIVHRDVKPENILLDKRGRVKIADFGLAKLLGRAGDQATLTRVEQVMGTPLYMAPEQMRGSHAVDHRADIYSLGVVFYEMLTGELPLGRFAPPSHKVQVDVRLDEVVLRTLEREPDRRYQHASDVKTEVESIVASPAPAPAGSAKDAAITTPTPCPAKVRAPAIGLLITGIFNWVWMPLGGGAIAYAYAISPRTELGYVHGGLLALAAVAILVTSTIVMLAALKMMRCEAYGLAMSGSVLAMLVCPGNVIGLPIGIWALVVLLRRDVKAAFPSSRKARHDVRREGGRSLRRFEIVPVVTAVSALVCLMGAGSAFLPWAELVSGTFRTVQGDWTFANHWQLKQPAAVVGFAWWQGLFVCFAFLATSLLLFANLAAQTSRWRLLAVGFGALLIVTLAAHFLAEFSRGNLLAEPFWTAADQDITFNGSKPRMIGDADIVVRRGPGAYVAMIIAAVLMALTAIEAALAARHRRSQTATSAAIVHSGSHPKVRAVEHAPELTDRRANLMANSSPQSGAASDEELIVAALRRSKNKIQAIRMYRDLTGAGLAAAKTAVEAVAKKHGIEFKALTQRERAWQIVVASLLLLVAIILADKFALSDSAKVGIMVGSSLLYMAFLIAHGIGARNDRLGNRISSGPRKSTTTHTWVLLLGLLGLASGLLPWGRVSWYGPDTSGAPDAPSRWNAQALYGWGSWEGKAVMAVFLVLALLRLASGFGGRPKRWQAASLIVGAVGVLTLCYLSRQDRITPQLPSLVSNLVRVELQPGLAVPVALAVALLVVAAVEWRVAREESGQTLPPAQTTGKAPAAEPGR